ncbi:type II toxin-antitoxin system VapC family toxin [Picosynechococcus sp. PCC 11901]|uniref:type II toxin-antitoxin system VapC family toxin n=1 Tax=Picosynechococcus sp. PCC 11901 TaxID=2579791 RepID=UPI0010FC0BF4|nr:type II toxin-antitoxin system VapC family toxin [Picosynechococcus sp. PCC 11901]QCS50717.1 type II toxin-antitoxin system VapC family toxin [Picosynechococcus sp. PCC 11901]
MTYLYLLDTNIISDLVKHPSGKIAQRIAEVGEAKICTNIVVAAELRFGAEKSGSLRLKQQVNQILEVMPVLPLESPVEFYYAEIRTYLEREGTPIGANDLLIAAHGLALNLTVVTANQREFSRVPHLAVENWL